VKLFTLVVNNAFRDQENFSHEEVFGHLRTELFSSEEAATYLEISLPTLRRLVQSKRLQPKQVVGRSQLFTVHDLKFLKSVK
jgi:excisionase family DNA binding protein